MDHGTVMKIALHVSVKGSQVVERDGCKFRSRRAICQDSVTLKKEMIPSNCLLPCCHIYRTVCDELTMRQESNQLWENTDITPSTHNLC